MLYENLNFMLKLLKWTCEKSITLIQRITPYKTSPQDYDFFFHTEHLNGLLNAKIS